MRKVAIGLVALVVAGCSSSGETGSGAPFDVPGEPVATTEVDLPKSYLFEPDVIAIEGGDTVTWTNSDDFPHNVHLLDGSDRTVELPIGGSADLTFDTAGDLYYECSIHPQQMRGRIVVG